MAKKRALRRAGSAVLAGTMLSIGVTAAMASPAMAAPGQGIPPIDCGNVYGERGPLSAPIHVLDQTLWLVDGRTSESLHEFNCNTVIGLELTLGLQPKAGY